MNDLNLISCGIKEMSEEEMVNVEGGSVTLFVVGCIILAAMCYYSSENSAR
jgi:lactobin A/cerein 7B family class IIb bacteriocin